MIDVLVAAMKAASALSTLIQKKFCKPVDASMMSLSCSTLVGVDVGPAVVGDALGWGVG